LQKINQEMKELSKESIAEYCSRKGKNCDLKNIIHNYLFQKIKISCTVSRQPKVVSAHKLHKAFLQQDIRTSSSHVWTQLAVSLCFLTCTNSQVDASSRKSMFCIMSGHKRQDSGHKSFSCRCPDTRATCSDMLQRKFNCRETLLMFTYFSYIFLDILSCYLNVLSILNT
jgi:hypothetical protein